MQWLACSTPKMPGFEEIGDEMILVLLGYCRKRDDLPRLWLQLVTDQIVLMQPLHDNDDAALGLVIEPA